MISVIISTKNGSRFITRALDSIFDQTYATDPSTKNELEVIVVNDGSTDSTSDVVTSYIQKESRVHLITLPKNIGPGLARDHAIQQAQGEYIAILDDDDRWISKNKLTLQKKFLDDHTDYVLVGSSKIILVDESGRQIGLHLNKEGYREIKNTMLWRNNFANSSVFFRKDTYQEVGGFKAMYLAEDYDLWLRMGLVGKYANLSDCEIAYTIRKGNASTLRQKEMYSVILHLVQEHQNDYPHYFRALAKAYARILFVYIKNLF